MPKICVVIICEHACISDKDRAQREITLSFDKPKTAQIIYVKFSEDIPIADLKVVYGKNGHAWGTMSHFFLKKL